MAYKCTPSEKVSIQIIMIAWHEDDHLIEGKWNDKAEPQNSYPAYEFVVVTLKLMVAMCFFIWPLALQLWSGR